MCKAPVVDTGDAASDKLQHSLLSVMKPANVLVKTYR